MYVIKSIVCELPDGSLVKGDLYYSDTFKVNDSGFTIPEGVNTIEIVLNFNDIIIKGILAEFEPFTSSEKVRVYHCKKQDSQSEINLIESIMEHAAVDYPFLPLPEPRVKVNDFVLTKSIPVIPEDFVPPEDKKIYLDIFKDVVSNSSTKTSDSQVRFWRKYAYERMSEIMETARTTPYDMDSISSSPYLSIRILNEYNNVKYNWVLVTSNYAIMNRDILNNPDFPWDPESLYSNRILPKGFYIYKGIKVPRDFSADECFGNDKEDDSTMLTSDEVIRDYSSYLPIESEVKVEIQDIEDSLEMIKEEYPEYFEDASENFLVSIRESIIEMIKSEGTFILDDFVFPSSNIEKVREDKEIDVDVDSLSCKKIVLPEPTKEDPYSVRDVIDEINNYELPNYSSQHIHYKKVIGIDLFFVKNRSEYLKVLENFKPKSYSYQVEKCVFFEPGDVIRFPLAFNFPRKSFASIVVNSRKMSLEYFLENPDINFSLSDLVRCLPVEYVVKNLLFYPNRLKLGSFHFNKGLKVQNFHNEMLKLDSYLMSIFTDRSDFIHDDYEIIYKYPMINWKLNLYKPIPQLRKFYVGQFPEEKKHLPFDFEKKDPFIDNFDFYSFDYIISSEGVRMFSNYSGKKIDFEEFESKTVEEKKDTILKIVKTKKELLQLFSDIIPISYISVNKKTKWFAPNSINYHRLFNSYIEEFGNFEGFFVFLKFFDRISERTYAIKVVMDNMKELFSLSIKQMYETSENKSSIYEYFVKASLVIISLDMAIFNYDKFLPTYKLDYLMTISEMFTIEDVSNSQFTNYSYFIKMLSKILKKIDE